jgi:hypothetical protein
MNNELKDHLTHIGQHEQVSCCKCKNPIPTQPLDYEEKQESTTPLVEIHYEYCHGIYVVLGLLIGMIIGFCFGVAR